MEKVNAILPMRAGSQRVKDKNIRVINGKPLYQYILDQLFKTKHIFSFLNDFFYTVPLEFKRFTNYTFDEHESYPPFLSASHQQELLGLIHAFKF
jgi:molybdopterin-guanine dinucleotide biosynthesis protein A